MNERQLRRACHGVRLPPAAIGPYQILREVGHGGMGTVYEAKDAGGRRVAVKIMNSYLAGETAVKRFEREARILARLAHPNVVRVYDLGEHDGRPFIAMEFVDGRRFADLALRERVPALLQAARGIGAAHARGIVHRDITPGNILVDSRGRAVVTDFGLARAQGQSRWTAPTVTIGTRGFIAPEVEAGVIATMASDVWALGRILEDVAGTAALRRVAGRATHADPRRRHADATAFAQDLEWALAGRSRVPWFVAVALVAVAAVSIAAILLRPAPQKPSAPAAPPSPPPVVVVPAAELDDGALDARIAHDAGNVEALLERARRRRVREAWDDAASDYEAAGRANPSSVEAIAGSALVRVERMRPDDAALDDLTAGG